MAMMTSALLRMKTWCIAYEYEVAHHVLHAAVLCSSCTYVLFSMICACFLSLYYELSSDDMMVVVNECGCVVIVFE